MLPDRKTQVENNFDSLVGFIYGPPKVGKTTFASQFDNALLLATERGYAHLEVYKYDITCWEDFTKVLPEIAKSPKFKVVVIDTIDLLWDYCVQNTCKVLGIEDLSDAEWGKGWKHCRETMTRATDRLAKMGKGIIFISHSTDVVIKTRVSETNRTLPTLPKTARKVILPLADYIGYCYADEEGKRYILFAPRESLEAGDRTSRLPQISPLDFRTIRNHFKGEHESATETKKRTPRRKSS